MSRNREFSGPRGHPNDFCRFREQDFSDYLYGTECQTIDSQFLGKDRRSTKTPGVSRILVIIKKITLESGS